MKASVFSAPGGPENLRLETVADPNPGPSDVIVQTQFIGVNFADIYRRRGEYPVEPPQPFVLGHEAAGVIVAVGSSVRDLVVGDRVAFAHVPRANAELVCAPAWKVVKLPALISTESAAALMLQGLTAHYLAHDSYKIKAGDTVLIHSASGGVGMLLTQIAKILGARVIGTVSQNQKVAAAKESGADEVIVRLGGCFKDRVLELNSGKLVDVVYDGIGSTLDESLQSVRSRGTVVFFGWAGGAPQAVNPAVLMADSKSLVGAELWSHIDSRADLLRRSNALFGWVQQGALKIQIGQKLKLAQASEAHRYLESGTSQGKILLTP
jgi:NADPH2:quinone reductase